MRAFKHISKIENIKLRETFPSIGGEEFIDESIYLSKPISLWNDWLRNITDDVDKELWDVSKAVIDQRDSKFCSLAIDIVNSYEVFSYFFGCEDFKKLRSRDQLLQDIIRKRELTRNLFIPEISAIYMQTYDYTSWVWYRDETLISDVKNMVKNNEMFFIGEDI